MAAGDDDELEPIKRLTTEFWEWLRAQNIPLHEWIMAWSTFAIFVVTACQAYMLYTGSKQTDALVGYARGTTTAAQSFSNSAALIVNGVNDAAQHLGNQVDKLDATEKQTERLANNVEFGNTNAVDADRPRLGAAVEVRHFEVGQVPVYSLVFYNSGNRPAFYKDFQMEDIYDTTAPVIPTYQGITVGIASEGIVPARGNVSQALRVFKSAGTENKLLSGDLDLLEKRQRVLVLFGTIDYQDSKTGKRYFTHVCKRYVPNDPIAFLDCPSYNDAN